MTAVSELIWYSTCCCTEGHFDPDFREALPTSENVFEELCLGEHVKVQALQAYDLAIDRKPFSTEIFTVEVSSHANGLGMGLVIDQADSKFCLISGIVPSGAIDCWNAQNLDDRVQVGDRICAVNGKGRGARDIAARLRSHSDEQSVRLLLQRPRIFQVVLQCNCRELGVNVQIDNTKVGVMITKVKDGPLQDWNRSHPSSAVLPFDRIVALNGHSEHPVRMAELLQDLFKKGGKTDIKLTLWSWSADVVNPNPAPITPKRKVSFDYPLLNSEDE